MTKTNKTKNIDTQFPIKLRERRIALDLTQQELADTLGTSLRNIQNWENGTNIPSEWSRRLLMIWLYNLKCI